MKPNNKKAALVTLISAAIVAIALLIWWITRRRAERSIIGVSGTSSGGSGNIVTGVVQAVIDKGREIIGMRYFTINELTRSATAKKLGIDNTPTPAVRANLEALVVNCLDPVRTIYGRPIIVTSGYRCPELNAAVGGVANSQHTTGNAADLQPASGGSLDGIFRAAVQFGDFDQMILEEVGGSRWIHLSWRETGRRRRILLYRNGSYTDITSSWEQYV